MARPIPAGNPRDLGTKASTGGRSSESVDAGADAANGSGGVWPFTGVAAAQNSRTSTSGATAELPTPARLNAPPATAPESLQGDDGPAHRIKSGNVEYEQPGDGTLQFLPGRLQVVDGDDQKHEIRFVRAMGEATEITFGRNTGKRYRHVQLHSQTVSRMHARLTFADGSWLLTNLSETNPTVVNGQALDTSDATLSLRDGDRIELGEVVFVFREK